MRLASAAARRCGARRALASRTRDGVVEMDDGTRLAYSVHGDESASAKRPLMLIHGWACGGADWGAWPKLLSHARPVLTFDQRGTGAGAHDAAAAAAAAVAAAGGAPADLSLIHI